MKANRQQVKLISSTLIVLMGVGLLFFAACGDDKPVQQPPKKVEVKVPDFNADSAYVFVEKQVDFGPRVPNTTAHLQCANWMKAKFEQYGAKVMVQEAIVNAFDGTPLQMKNIIASYKPDKANRILLTAHWDTRPFADEDTVRQSEPILGANDGGSGVGVLLEMARLFQMQAPNMGVDIILWDCEDYGKSGYENSYCLGSQYWSRNKHKANYTARYGINLDMVGAKEGIFLKEGFSMQYAPNTVQKVWSTAHGLGYGEFFSTARVSGIVDDHLYMNQMGGVKTIDIIHMLGQGGFFPQWHTHGDNMDVISRETLKAVGQTVADVVYKEQ